MSINKDYYVIAGYDLAGQKTERFEDWKWTEEGEKFTSYQRKGYVQIFDDPMSGEHLYFGYILAHGDQYECPTHKIEIGIIEAVRNEVENQLQELIELGVISENCRAFDSYKILAFEECS